MEISEVAEMYILGKLQVDELPKVAADALETGQDSESLRRLAASSGEDSECLRRLFEKSLSELGLLLPSSEAAGLALVRRVARSVASGTTNPYDGAKQVWKICTELPQLKQLRIFVGLASEYEDDEMHRQYYSQKIIDECKKLLASDVS